MSLSVIRSREVYRQLCEAEESIPLFSQAWWLEAVAGRMWDAVLAYQGKQVVGALPFTKQRKWGFTLITQPTLTQTLGPWLRPDRKSYPKALAHEKHVLGALADGLPRYHHYAQNWYCDRQNWLPFYWRGYDQTTRYTYRLCGLDDEDAIWKGFQENIRREIRKAHNRFKITIRSARNIDEFMALNYLSFDRQGRSLPYSKDFVAQIEQAAAARNARDCLVAVDLEDNCHAGAYIVRQGNVAYYLMGGGDPVLRNSGAMSLVLWEAIRRQPSSVDVFDFEGSMVEPIERFFRAFGARQVPYHRVSRTPSRMLKAAAFLKSLIKRSP